MKRLSLFTLLTFFLSLSAQPASAQTELVTNGSLDSFDGSGLASGWNRWWEETPNPNNGSLDYAGKPDWSPESNPALTLGGQSQHIGTTWNPWHAGIFQTVTASPGTQIRITASGRAYASNDNFPTPSDSTDSARMQIGADPNGGTEWYSGNVQWSGQGNPHDTWQTFSLDVTVGASGKVTIFLSANYKSNSRLHQDVWWENVSAQVLNTAPTPTLTSAPATAAPASSVANPTPTTEPPTPSSAVTETQPAPTAESPTATTEPPTLEPTQDTRPGTACITVFEDTNGNGTQDANETTLTNSTLTLNSNSSPAPHCFDNLAPGEYSVSATLPPGYFATTGNTLAFTISGGQQLNLQIGAQSSRIAQPSVEATATPMQASDSTSTILIVAGFVVFLLLAIGGAAGFMFLRTRR
jgi:uncharacterized protein (DUF2141 family)